jgi:hypothetical protein
VSKLRETLLRQQPFSRKPPGERLPEPADVEAALRECELSGLRDVDSGRVVAYAWYHGVQNDTVLDLIRKSGAETVLLRELSGHKARDRSNDAQLITSLMHRGNFGDLANALGDSDAGWALAVISAVEIADFGTLISSLNAPEDVMQLIPLHFLTTLVPPAFRLPLTKKFLAVSDTFSRDVFIALLCRWSEDAVLYEDRSIETMVSEIEALPTHRVIVVGALFDHILRRFGHARLPDAQQTRVNQVCSNAACLCKNEPPHCRGLRS